MPFRNAANESEKLDVEILIPGDKFPVVIGPGLAASKWRGGVWVRYVTGGPAFMVEISDGVDVAGFLMFASENYTLDGNRLQRPGSHYNYTSIQPGHYPDARAENVVTMMTGGPRAAFSQYETKRLVAGDRTGADITYNLHDSVRVSENGLLTNDSDVDLATVGIANPVDVGIVSDAPSESNGLYLTVDVKY